MRGILVLSGIIAGSQLLADDFLISDTLPYGEMPKVAWNGTNFLVVWSQDIRGYILGQLVSNDGILVDTSFVIIYDSLVYTLWPEVASDGENYLVVWFERDFAKKARVYGQLVSSDGSLIDTNIGIAVKPDTQCFPKVAYAGTTYLVVWEESINIWGGPIYGQFISRDGALIDTNFCIYPWSDGSYPAVIGGDSNFLVVWGLGDIRGQLVGFEGSLIGSLLPISVEPYQQTEARGAFDGEKYFVAWGDKRDGGYAKTYGQFVNPTGVLVDTNFPIITKENGFAPLVAWDGENYLVVGGDGVLIKGQFVDKNGALVDTNFTVSTLDTVIRQARPAVAWSNMNYLVVWDEENREGEGYCCDVYGNIVPPAGVEETRSEISDVGLQIHPNPFYQVTSIRYQVPGIRGQITDVRMQLYDMAGRLVKTLVDEERTPGCYETKLDAGNLASGVYFLKLKSDKLITIKKIIIVH